MTVYFRLFFTASIGISAISCGEKKETDSLKTTSYQAEITENQSPEEFGKELFEGKGMCATCHKTDQKIIGPSIREISKIYSDQKASISLFLQGESDPIVDPSQYEIMKANLEITKIMTEEELLALESYMLSVK